MPETQVVAALEKNKYYTHQDLFYVNRHSFWLAGQDSWTLPPAQDQDMFQQLLNVEPVLQGVLQRRRGYTLFTNSFGGNVFTHAYSFRSEAQSLRELVFCSPTNVVATDEVGNTVLNPVFTPSLSSGAPRMVLSRDYGYFANQVQANSIKWDGTFGTGSTTNWGIDIGSAVSTFGPNLPQAGSSTNTGTPWTTPNNILATDGVTSTVTLVGSKASSQQLRAQLFGFAIPATNTISGIQVTVRCSTNNSSILVTSPATLMKAGVSGGSPRYVQYPLNFLGFTTLGGPTDLWGQTWLPSDINNPNFGVDISAFKTFGGTVILSVDSVTVTVFIKTPPITIGATAAGNINLLSGRTYFYVLQNSLTGHCSDLSSPSLSTGPLTNNNQTITNLPPTCLDPQVDTLILLATADGGDQTFLYFLASLPFGTTSYVDNTPDSLTAAVPTGASLLTNNIYQETDEFGFLHGVANNKIPPLGTFPIKHKGRLYMAKGHILFFSKNLDDVTTSTGITTGKWEEAWPAINQIDISIRAETISGLLSDGETLWIGTERAVRRLIGDSPQNFQEPEVQFNETGVLNQEVWQVVFYEGQPVGTIWMTPDLRVIASDFNSYQDIGTPIQDVLNSVNPAAIQACHASFVSQGPADYYMLYLATGTNTLPDTVCVFNLRAKKWCIWQPTDQATASLFNINGSGQPQWLFTDASGNINFWDSTVTQDRNGSTPVTYPVTVQTTWLDMGDYNIRKFVNQIIPTTADQTSLTIQVNAASNEQDFNNPLSVVPATTVSPASIPTDVFVPLASGPSHSRAFQFTFVSPPSTIKNILTGFAIEAGQFHRY